VLRDNPTMLDAGSSGGAHAAFLQGGGEMGARMREMDWAPTPVGAPNAWPQSLRSTLSMLLPSKAQIILFWGPEFVVFYNDAYRTVFGAKHPKMLGRSGREAWSEIWDSVLHELLSGVVRTGDAFWARDMMFELERFGFPEETYFDVSYDPVRDESGSVGGVFCIVTETTERVIGERRLALLKDLAATSTARTVHDACVLTMTTLAARPDDVTFALVYVDAERRAGTPGAEARLAAAPPEQIRELSVPSSGSQSRPARLVVGINPRRPFDDQYRGFLDLVAGQLGAALGNARAYEEERQRAEAFAEIDRAKTAFFSNVSHEFRTPLTLMMGPLEDTLAEPGVPALMRERLELAHRNSLRLLKLVNALLDFARLEAGRIEAVYEPTDLAGLTTALASNFRSAVERAGMTLTVDCQPLDPVYVDRSMWEKIVLNLLSNAFKFTFDGGIEVSLRQAGEVARLQVRDSGTGIPADELPLLFERFHRVRDARGRSYEGSGIGLALVQELARLHGGAVGVESTVDRGSVFTVTIPLGTAHLPADRVGAARPHTATGAHVDAFVEEALRWLPDEGTSPALSSEASGVAREARVVVADDNADMRDYLCRILGPLYEVAVAGDGAAALERIRANPPDLVVADVMMPTLDGFGLLAAVRGDARLRSLPVILLSARAGEEARIEGLDAGADDYLVKPFTARELVASVRSQLQLSRLRRESEAERTRLMEESSRLKDNFLASLSHELRTPLNAILGYARMLRTGVMTADKQHKAVETIERNATSLSQLVEDVLDISRIVSGKIRLNVQPVNLPDIVRNALDVIGPAADARGVRVEAIVDPQAGPIAGDPERLQQVLWNLMANAVKFTDRGGKVQVRLERVNSHIEFVVSDTGIGIAPEFLPHVFERFRQADDAASRERGGLGLGLAIARQLAEMHGGTIEASSDGPGRGSTFLLKIPVMILHSIATDTPRVHPRSPAAIAGGIAAGELTGVRILAVDDERDARALLAEALEAAGALVETAASAEEALSRLDADVPGVVIADLGMPGMDGFQFIERIRQHANPAVRGIPAAALTAYARSDDRMKALRAGFHIHLAKPIDPAELVTSIAALRRFHAS
jgi:signal transduction histidine kinase